jgi:phosphoglycerate dehydrogenase-like enzyme
VSTHAAGVDHYPIDLLAERRQILTNGAGINAPPIAEFAVLCVLSASKSLPYFLDASRRRVWPERRPAAAELGGSRALVVGYGEIGRAVGDRLRALGVRVTGVRRQPSEEPDITGPDEWRDRLAEFDWVLTTAALTPHTRHMFGAQEFAQMCSTAWFVNVARGGLVDHAALAIALASGRPCGAYLDVTEPEPLPSDHPLWGMPNVFITGHSAGRSPRSRERYVSLFLDNLARFQRGEPLLNVVDLAAGY